MEPEDEIKQEAQHRKRGQIREQVRAHFTGCIENFFISEISRPELLNRLGNNIVPFNFIDTEDVQTDIIKSHLKRIKTVIDDLYKPQGYKIEFNESSLSSYIIKKYNEQISYFGGRGITNAIDNELMHPLTIEILRGISAHAEKIVFRVGVKDGNVVVEYT